MTEFKKGDIVKHKDTARLYVIRGVSSYYASVYEDGSIVSDIAVDDIKLASPAEKEIVQQYKVEKAEDELRIARNAVLKAQAKLDALNSGQN